MVRPLAALVRRAKLPCDEYARVFACAESGLGAVHRALYGEDAQTMMQSVCLVHQKILVVDLLHAGRALHLEVHLEDEMAHDLASIRSGEGHGLRRVIPLRGRPKKI
jgi:hypothetical protein